MKIPTSFQLFGQTIRVEYDNTLIHRSDNLGETFMRENKIVIQKPSDIYPAASKEDTERVFLHELTHCILITMSEDALSNSEKFVDVFARLLHQALKTGKVV